MARSPSTNMNFWARAPLNLVADRVKNSVPPLLRTLRFCVGGQEAQLHVGGAGGGQQPPPGAQEGLWGVGGLDGEGKAVSPGERGGECGDHRVWPKVESGGKTEGVGPATKGVACRVSTEQTWAGQDLWGQASTGQAAAGS